jgi:hypothetical protein
MRRSTNSSEVGGGGTVCVSVVIVVDVGIVATGIVGGAGAGMETEMGRGSERSTG